jgi:hypothetical protein
VRVLPRVVVQAVAVGLASLAGLLGVTGCAQFDKALGQQQALVSFKSGTPVSVRLHVRTACSKLPNVSAEKIPAGVPLASAVDQVVYRVTNASNADLARLQECVEKFPSVQGMSVQDSTDNS